MAFDILRMSEAFEFVVRTRLLAGPGQAERVGEVVAEFGVRRVMLVTDPGLVAAGHAAKCTDALRKSSLDLLVFDRAHENPTTETVAAGLAAARDFQPELLVSLGGGSAMDTAKGVNFLHTNGGSMEDYWGTGKARLPMLPSVAIPTTAGTGSEMQSYALIARAVDGTKMACGDPKAAFRVALLDPLLVTTCPTHVAALAGIDALSHAIETYVTRKRNPLSNSLAAQAFQRIAAHLPAIGTADVPLETWSDLQLGACLAGLAIENSMLGAAHALANPLTARFKVPHGQAVGVVLPHVIRYNGSDCEPWYAELLAASGLAVSSSGTATDRLARFVSDMLERLHLKSSLGALHVPESAVCDLARDAATQWTGSFNPRPLTDADAAALYQEAR